MRNISFATDCTEADFPALFDTLSPDFIKEHGIICSRESRGIEFRTYGLFEEGNTTPKAYSWIALKKYSDNPVTQCVLENVGLPFVTGPLFKPVPLEVLRAVFCDSEGMPKSKLAAQIMQAATLAQEMADNYPFIRVPILLEAVQREIDGVKPINRASLHTENQALHEQWWNNLPDSFKASFTLPDHIRPLLLELHEKLKPLSLWTDSQTSYSPSHDIGLDMFTARAGISSGKDVRSFDTRARTSAVMLRIAQTAGLIVHDLGHSSYLVSQVHPSILPYMGLKTEDGDKAMAFMSAIKGRFESGLSRRVSEHPSYLTDSVKELAIRHLGSQKGGIVAQWWAVSFPVRLDSKGYPLQKPAT